MKKVVAVVLSLACLSVAPRPAMAGLEALLPIIVPALAGAAMMAAGVPPAPPVTGPAVPERVFICAPEPCGPSAPAKSEMPAPGTERLAPASPEPVRPAPEQLFEN